MAPQTHKRQVIDLTGDSDTDNRNVGTGPKPKIRKTSHPVDQHSIPRTPTRFSPSPSAPLLTKYQHEINRLTNQILDYHAKDQQLRHENAELHHQMAQLQAELASARDANADLEAEVDELSARLPENASTTPPNVLRVEWRVLHHLVRSVVQEHLVRRRVWRFFPSQHHQQVFARLTRIPGPLLRDEKSRSLMFQAWIWEFLQRRIFARYSTFWGGRMGADEIRRYDEERAAMQELDWRLQSHRLDRSEAVNNILDLVPRKNPERNHIWALEMFHFFCHELGCVAGGVDIQRLICGFKRVLCQAAEVDVLLRRSKADFETELPSAGVGGCQWFDGEVMKVTNYRDGGPEVVLVVAPMVRQRGSTDGWNTEGEGVMIKSLVVVGRKEGEEDIMVPKAEEVYVKTENTPEVQVKEEGSEMSVPSLSEGRESFDWWY